MRPVRSVLRAASYVLSALVSSSCDGGDGGEPPRSDVGSSGSDPDAGPLGSCAGSLAGAATASFPCVIGLTQDRTLGLSSFGPSEVVEVLSITVRGSEPFAVRTYALGDLDVGPALVRLKDQRQFSAGKDVAGSSLALTLTAVEPSDRSAASTHGKLEATFVEIGAADGGKPLLTIAATF